MTDALAYLVKTERAHFAEVADSHRRRAILAAEVVALLDDALPRLAGADELARERLRALLTAEYPAHAVADGLRALMEPAGVAAPASGSTTSVPVPHEQETTTEGHHEREQSAQGREHGAHG